MKNRGILALLIAGCIFSAGLMGFFIGRNSAGEIVEVSRKEPVAQTPPTSAAAPPQATVPTTLPATEPSKPKGKININTATLEELDTLPDIGPVLAQRIIDYREEHGPFTTVSELTMVDGIGLSTLEKLIDHITVGGET